MKVSGWNSLEIDVVKICPNKKTTLFVLSIDSEDQEVFDAVNAFGRGMIARFPNNKTAFTGFSLQPEEVIEFESFEYDKDEDLDLIKGNLHINFKTDDQPFFDATKPINGFSKGSCPKCGDSGKWVNLALVCPNHGIFAG